MPKSPQKINRNPWESEEYLNLAPYACHAGQSRGRLYPEPESKGRSCFQRDRDRIIHSSAFRRLEYKTQVFVNHEGDHYRTRLTHSLEVSQLARSAARELGLNEDLAEALALSHDLGHTPFGHAGEDALSAAMKDFGGFDHNAQSIRILSKLEKKYAEFDGLNLTWETLEGIAKHNGPVKNPPRALAEYNKKHNLELDKFASAEAQVTACCDDIAYDNHDIEDGIRARLFTVDDVCELPLIGGIFHGLLKKYPGLSEPRLIHESKRRLINLMSADLVKHTRKNLLNAKVKTVDDVRNLRKPIAGFSNKMEKEAREIKKFLRENMYHHYKVNRMTSKARRIIAELFGFFYKEPECLPTEWRKLAGKAEKRLSAEIIADYIAGMTDRFAQQEYRRIFDLSYKDIGEFYS